jgi:hypothetical protein
VEKRKRRDKKSKVEKLETPSKGTMLPKRHTDIRKIKHQKTFENCFSAAYFLAAARFLGAALVAVLPVAAALAVDENSGISCVNGLRQR